MSAETIMFLSVIAFVVCFFGFVLVVMAAAFIFIFSRIFKIQTAAGEALAEGTDAFLARGAAEFYPLSVTAFEDISSQLEVNGRAALGNLHYRGRLQSLSQPGRGYMAFDLQLKFGKGVMHLRTDRQRLQLSFGGIGARQVQLAADGSPFGSLVDDNKQVSLLDPQGQALGVYRRHPLTVGGLSIEPTTFNFKSYYGAVELHGRTLAELNRNPLILRPGSDIEIAPLFSQVAFDLGAEEEMWLLFLAGWEVYVKIIVR